MELLVTDVTEMSAGHYCVAGWHGAGERMVRPLPEWSQWTAPVLDVHRIVPGARIRVDAAASPGSGCYPHRTEDTRVRAASIKSGRAELGPWFGPSAPPCCDTLMGAFEGRLEHLWTARGRRHGVHLKAGTRTRSLWAVRVPCTGLHLVEGRDKLRALLDDCHERYELAVSSRALKEAWRAGGLDAARRTLPREGFLHVRVGVARPYADAPDKCYVMVNGIHW